MEYDYKAYQAVKITTMNDTWKSKLTAFDAELCKMVESLTGCSCEPKNGGNHFYIEVDYKSHKDPDYLCAIMAAIEGRLGKRFISVKDDADRQCMYVYIRFYREPCKDAAFIPKIETDGRR